MKNENILELCLAPGLGGLEMFVASCYNNFSKQTSCKVVIAANSKLDSFLDISDKFYIKRSKFFPIFPALKLAKYIDQNEIDIIHFHWTKDIITAVLAKVLSKRKPKLVQSRHMGMTRFKDDFYHKWLYKNINMMHAVTNEVKGQLEKFIPEDVRPKLEMVYLGTEVKDIDQTIVEELRKKYNLTDQFVVGIVGRMQEEKGQHKVIEAVAKLKDLNIKAFIVGSAMYDEYLHKLEQMIKEFGLEDKVVLTGFTKQVNEYMQLFDVNVLATEHETFGLVVIEAMANKIPMIATAKGGPLEIIDDGKDGLLFDGTSDNLAQKIELLYNNKELVQTIAQAGYEKVMKKFNMSRQMKKLYEVLVQ
ncbi:glycosyltransferase family 4 protein [Sulfurimonas marina]|uniref:Glycosyltransferase family 4 protein n=1 Tax=Sulfurimonas marina TaxID=2590551 RepID=A0A7M1ATR5_9BACT|nr:glycosyltransferase family 4 protein [Sulfurimonas marina]QOP40813.1 glycosyltransferase family 4 protein [Sulfurimonas marina]